MGGPPCSTWSRAPFIWIPGGPRPLRRRGLYAWGIPRGDLTKHELARLDEGNVQMLNFLSLCESISKVEGVWLLEHPEDPGVFPYPSIWDTEVERALEVRTGAKRARLDQCMFGGPTRKPTCLAGTLEGLEEYDGCRCDGGHRHEASLGKQDGQFISARLATYPRKLCYVIALMLNIVVRSTCLPGMNILVAE